MDLKEAIDKLKVLIKFEENKPELKFAEIKLKDGSILVADGEVPEVGTPINVVTESGTLPAPDGEHVAEDGTTIIVKDGKIEAIKPMEKPSEPMESEAEVKMKALLTESEAKFEARLKALEDKANSAFKENNELKEKLSKQKEVIDLTFNVVEQLSKLPASASIKEVAPIEAKEDKFSAIAENLSKLKTLKSKK